MKHARSLIDYFDFGDRLLTSIYRIVLDVSTTEKAEKRVLTYSVSLVLAHSPCPPFLRGDKSGENHVTTEKRRTRRSRAATKTLA